MPRHCSNTARAICDYHLFEFVDLVVASVPLALASQTLHPLNQHASVPRAVENYDQSGIGKLFPETLQVVSAAFVRQRCRYRIHLEAARVQGPSEPADNSALARRIPSFEDDNGSLSGTEICLLDRLHD